MARILVADDEEGVRTFVAEALEMAGYDVDQAADGDEAARRAAERSYALVITDLKMPGLDGLALLARVKKEQPEVEVLVLTAHGTVDSAVEAMKLGAYDYVQKPIGSPAELRLIVERALERKSLLDLRAVTTEQVTRTRLSWGAPVMKPVVEALERVARTNATVLLLGESGTGKEVAARALHERSSRAQGPFVAVNCATLSPAPARERALRAREGRLHRCGGAAAGAGGARGGRNALPRRDRRARAEPAGASLLRVLQERTYERVGGTQTLSADVRWVAATNRDLHQRIAEGAFREDLYHRLAVFPVRLPPLRERKEDLAPLTEVLLADIARSLGRAHLDLDPAALTRIASAPWPGNVRELRNVLERAAILSDGSRIGVKSLWIEERPGSPTVPPSGPGVRPLDEMEREAITRALDEAEGNRKKAASLLGIGLRTLYDKLKRYDLR